MAKNFSEDRVFWDGAYVSNTPLIEIIQAHKEYWHQENQEKIPDLEVYVINLYQSIQNTTEKAITDPDGIQSREMEIKLSDRTSMYLEMLSAIMDHSGLSNRLITTGQKNSRNESGFRKDLENLLEEETNTLEYGNLPRKFSDLLINSFKVSKIGYIERGIDESKILGEAFEFSKRTIGSLKERI
jgi:NTE family protein